MHAGCPEIYLYIMVPPQLANILSTESLFYACIFPFIAFFGAFAFILYPLREQLHPTRESLLIMLALVDI